MLKSKVVKNIKRDLRQERAWIVHDFKQYDGHKEIKRLAEDIINSLEVTRNCIQNSLELYELD